MTVTGEETFAEDSISAAAGQPRRAGNGGRGSCRGQGGTGAAGTGGSKAAEPGPEEQPEAGEKEHRRELHLFNQIATITAHTLDLQEIINEILETVLAFFRIDAGFLLLWDPVRQRLTYAAARGLPQEYLGHLSGKTLEDLMEPSRSRAVKPLIIKDIRHDPRLVSSTFTDLIREDPAFRSVASIPLRYRDDIIGFLNLAAKSTRTFRSSRRQQYFLGILGNQIGLAIENARLYHQMRRSERRYRRIFEGSKDMIFVTDVEGRILDLNPAGVELLKFPSKAEALSCRICGKSFKTRGTGSGFSSRWKWRTTSGTWN